MWKIIAIIFFSCFSLLGVYAAQPQLVTRSQINVTDNGFVVNFEGHLYPVSTITYMESGIYAVSLEYYGSCGRCGWVLDKNGKCTNQNCNQYGPNRD